jgi:hypothetical protein
MALPLSILLSWCGVTVGASPILAGQKLTIQIQTVKSAASVSNGSNSPLTIPLSGTGTTETVQGQVFNVVGVPDSKEGYHCAINSGSNSLVCQDLTFSSSDVGHTINVYGAASATYYQALYTTISSVIDPSTVTLAEWATRSVSSAMVQVVGATNNFTAIQNAINAACSAATASNPSTVIFPPGTYGLSGTLFMPNGCSYVTWKSAGGPVVLLETAIVSKDPTQKGFGQGLAVLAFGNNSAPGRATNSLSGTSISAGSDVLTCSSCAFTTADIGKPIYVQYAGAADLPLWTTITGVNGSSATLADHAQTTLPLSPQGLLGPAIVIGYQVMRNIDIGGIDFHNIGYWYQDPGLSVIGFPLVQFGEATQVAKQGLTFHDLIMLSATNGCTANNGPLDSSTLSNVTCLGATDAGFYISGQNSKLTLKNLVVDNTQYPVPGTGLDNGFLVKSPSSALFDHPTVHCHCRSALITVGDYNNFDITIQNGDFNGEGTTSAGIFSNITKRLTIQNNSLQGIRGDVFEFQSTYAGGIDNVSITGNKASNSGAAISVSDNNAGVGPSNINFQNNVMQVTGNGIIALHTRGINYWSLNQLTNVTASKSAAWQIFNTAPGTTNHVNANTTAGYRDKSVCDSSCIF